MQNFLNPVEFRFTIKRLPNVEYYIQGVNFPGISSSSTDINTPFKTIHAPGDTLTYNDLTLTVLLDENMKSYRDTFDWLVALTRPEDFESYKGLLAGDGVYSDATLTILNSNKNANIELTFKDIFPIEVGTFQLSTTQSDVVAPTFDITFKHAGYSIKVNDD